MSFRELRDFTEIMRALGYPRLISVENFRTPNFGLVADVLYWMVQRYDSLVSVSDNIETEDDRVAFLKSISQIMAGKARIMLKTKNLYAADGKAVKELLKIARTLYRAHRIQTEGGKGKGAGAARGGAGGKEPEGDDDDDSSPFALSSKLQDLKSTRAVATNITAIGVQLYDLLGQEQELAEARRKALIFLDAISSNLDSRAEHSHMEQSIRDAITSVKENVVALERQVQDLQADQRALEAKIKKKQADLERSEKRLRSMQAVRPAFMDEYEKLEKELAEEYEVYLERFRNLDYLEHELDVWNTHEREKLEASDRALKRLQKRLRDEELRMFIGEQDVGADDEEGKRAGGAGGRAGGAGAGVGGAARPAAAGKGKVVGGGAGGPGKAGAGVVGSMAAGESDDSDSDGSGTGTDDSDSDGQVSLGGSDSGSDLIDDDGEDSGLGSSGSGSGSGSDNLGDSMSDNEF